MNSGVPPITGRTRLLGIVGDPITQVGAPAICNSIIAKAGVDTVLIPLHVPAPDFEATMPGLMRLANLDGLIFTVPFKQRGLAFAQTIHPDAALIGAANALRREPDGTWTADMFDGTGLLRAIEGTGVAVHDASVLLLGAGGAGRAIAVAVARAGASRLAVHDLDHARAVDVAALASSAAPNCAAAPAAPTAAGHDIVINATPIGMKPGDGLPAPLGPLAGVAAVIDIVPYPPKTPLLAAAAEAGCRTEGGQAMIAGQAHTLLEFFGIRPA
jgi:shikimate dehydrogenase